MQQEQFQDWSDLQDTLELTYDNIFLGSVYIVTNPAKTYFIIYHETFILITVKSH